MKDQNQLHNLVHKYMYTLTFTGQRPLGEICLSISLPPTKVVDEKARRGSIQVTKNEQADLFMPFPDIDSNPKF